MPAPMPMPMPVPGPCTTYMNRWPWSMPCPAPAPFPFPFPMPVPAPLPGPFQGILPVNLVPNLFPPMPEYVSLTAPPLGLKVETTAAPLSGLLFPAPAPAYPAPAPAGPPANYTNRTIAPYETWFERVTTLEPVLNLIPTVPPTTTPYPFPIPSTQKPLLNMHVALHMDITIAKNQAAGVVRAISAANPTDSPLGVIARNDLARGRQAAAAMRASDDQLENIKAHVHPDATLPPLATTLAPANTIPYWMGAVVPDPWVAQGRRPDAVVGPIYTNPSAAMATTAMPTMAIVPPMALGPEGFPAGPPPPPWMAVTAEPPHYIEEANMLATTVEPRHTTNIPNPVPPTTMPPPPIPPWWYTTTPGEMRPWR